MSSRKSQGRIKNPRSWKNKEW